MRRERGNAEARPHGRSLNQNCANFRGKGPLDGSADLRFQAGVASRSQNREATAGF